MRLKASPALKGLRDVSEPNGTAHEDFRAETNLLS